MNQHIDALIATNRPCYPSENQDQMINRQIKRDERAPFFIKCLETGNGNLEMSKQTQHS